MKTAKVFINIEQVKTATIDDSKKPITQSHIEMLSIEEIRAYITPIIKKYPVERVILFGSHARGDAINTSDVDLIVESQGRLRNRKIFALGGELLTVLPVRVDVYDILEIANPSVMYDNIMKEGVVIYDSTR
jgi:predicted nucleotidyltransferase